MSLEFLRGKLVGVRFFLTARIPNQSEYIYFHRQELRSHYISLAFSLTRSIKRRHRQHVVPLAVQQQLLHCNGVNMHNFAP